MSMESPVTIDDLEDQHLIGEGASAQVYRAYHRQWNQQVAVKVLPKDLVEEIEIEVMTNFQHDNLITCYGCDRDDTNVYVSSWSVPSSR